MILLFAILSLSIDTNIAEKESSRIYEGLRNGKQMKELVNVEEMKKNYPASKDFINTVEGIGFPKLDCYSDVLKDLQYNCDVLTESQRELLALKFTKCYFNITNRLEQFPHELPESQQIQNMSLATYSTYQILKIHVTHLCYFARDTLMNSITSDRLIYLFDCVVSSSKSIESYSNEFEQTSTQLQGTVADINEKLQKGKESMDLIVKLISNFQDRLGSITHFLEKANNTINSLSLYIIVLLCTFTIAYYLPETLIPVIILTLALYFGDKKLMGKYDWWIASKTRKGLRLLYLALCASYPAYISVLSILSIINSFRRKKRHHIFNTAKKPLF
ncbi:hypothetical protein TVAG_093800 [Trichomonas vaginalis G3]|uniref:Uncharacterized protein n=1 Tax=Trichomonas vaginalis (strain ATCC PRA-98 / G3) TaxID=412133 RepID=A2DBK3_TRIV3|nr:gamete expressed 1 family [Trichomonas vaginalis G3]EAY22206.1 hypothetical protein TVAG_093800 [Trichomonas vaginalis G3]KAI5533336.1 gamete expressed 1 family [Trichomonas vaginalis G3]|eukprot:XP_001583192.1 hypothetical protein [Trichomonas vaginalis G3]